MFYLFHGSDEFSMREELARLRRDGSFDYNEDSFSGAETELGTIIATCDTLPFLSARRLVVVDGLPKRRRAARARDQADEEVGAASSGGLGFSVAKDAPTTDAPARTAGGKGTRPRPAGPDPRAFAQRLADYASHLPATTVLVALVDELLEATHPLVQAAKDHGKAVTFVPPRGADLERWIERRAQTLNVQLTTDAARQLAGYVGIDLRALAGEIDKLATYAGDGGQIGAGEVRLLTPSTQQVRVFDLTDALARRNHARALALLHELLDAGESPLGIVALTAHQTRTLMQVKALVERGMRPPQISQTAGLAPFVVEKSLALARQFSFAQLERAHRALLSIDTALKLSKMTPEMALDLFVVEFGG
jgi:DNA polymerase-3 subunit delta